MITTCTECQARYQLDAEKIPPRVIKVRCPSCGGVFSLDGSLAKNQAQKEETQPQVKQPAVPEPAATVPATPEPVATVPATPEPVATAPATPEPVATVDAAPKKSSASVAVMDRPAPSSSRRRRSKEEMLARALVSDIMVYNQDLYDRAKAEGNLLEALGSEIKKSWELYKEKVTPEVANSTNHFRDALNEILADGDKLF
ncbi:MAG: zinc-ribbon domain-containing protein [Candidatus Krumholzibacteria bacterium]|nr:zinc-ribbon domain-containing protein [Candidatus Krumholzibacteria bacterium]